MIWLLTSTTHCKYVATLLFNLSLMACFLALLFYKVVWQHTQGDVGHIRNSLLQIYCIIRHWMKFENRLRFDRIMVMTLMCRLLAHPFSAKLLFGNYFYFSYAIVSNLLPSVLWRCWLGGRKGIRPVKKLRVVGCWCGYLSGARCRLAYGPADATATHCLLLQ